MRTITFYINYQDTKSKNSYYWYCDTLVAIKHWNHNVHTTQIALISFDLLKHFDKMFLNVNGEVYELKLGINTWTDKELRVEHDLLKLVTAHFLTDL